MKDKLYTFINVIGIWLVDIIALAWPSLFIWLVYPVIPFWKIWLGLYGITSIIPIVVASLRGAPEQK